MQCVKRLPHPAVGAPVEVLSALLPIQLLTGVGEKAVEDGLTPGLLHLHGETLHSDPSLSRLAHFANDSKDGRSASPASLHAPKPLSPPVTLPFKSTQSYSNLEITSDKPQLWKSL